MRLVLLPISTKRTLLYCIRNEAAKKAQKGIADKVGAKAASIWAGWERRESGWQRKVVDYGNHALRRIPFQEWGLKSVPPLSTRRQRELLSSQQKVELSFPPSVISPNEAEKFLHTLGTEREALHRMRLIWCFVGMPITAPVALLPVVPNIPFFYLAYRAWSHWRAIKGGQHVQFLVKNKLLSISPSSILDSAYAIPKLAPASPNEAQKPMEEKTEKDAKAEPAEPAGKVLLCQHTATTLSKALDHPELEAELERAIWQVEQSNRADKEKTESKKVS
ncbi:hypothetical protein jhhlp_003712 [Lomentospora prolificans]|uniref:Mitochondrial K+-H+ exchange-related-domain-containing protein n=1 Tax=Lomentospora prolificans TaxID=41688 RepID=A0A2N3N9H5_9PEZI|nr:hypothetical protein jhhlp_003712 [Lomentospora prolificans]